MKTLIIHLSDIHISSAEDYILKKTKKIKQAIQNIDLTVEICFIIVTGDISYSGDSIEYSIAEKFFTSLKNEILSTNHIKQVDYVITPGNHDCTGLKNENSIRDLIISECRNKKTTFEVNDEKIKHCVSVQTNFFDFISVLTCEDNDEKSIINLHNNKNFEFDDFKITFKTYNTAWMSELHEEQGKLIFPMNKIIDYVGKSDLIISVFHHPYNWMNANNAMEFKNHIGQTSDFIFTGHEHNPSKYSKSVLGGEINEFIEGAVLQEHSRSNESAFNAVLIDLANKKQKFYQFQWKEDIYAAVFESKSWEDYQRNMFLLAREFVPNNDFIFYLHDVGINISNLRKEDIKLSDIYIYPQLRERTNNKISKMTSKIVKSEEVSKYIFNNKKVLIIGAESSGKSSLGKTLYLESLQKNLIPVLLNGNQINNCKDEMAILEIYNNFEKQYSKSVLEKYKQIDNDKKVLIIDDFHKSSLNHDGKNKLIEFLEKFADVVIVIINDDIRLEDITYKNKTEYAMYDFKHCQIMPFGHYLKNKLIEKWYTFGDEPVKEQYEIEYMINNAQKVISAIQGKNLLPSFPIFILIMLQQIESNTKLKTETGTYGYMYEFLITRSLSEGLSENIMHKFDLNTRYNYLSEIAFFMFDNKMKLLGLEDIKKLHERYCKLYKTTINFDSAIKTIIDADIISHYNDIYRFKYKYIYLYFVARYLSKHIYEANIRELIIKIIKKLYVEEYANIVVFLSYLSNDPMLINEMLNNAKQIFKDQEPCNLDLHIDFINKVYSQVPQFVLSDKSYKENVNEILIQKDESAFSQEMISKDSDSEPEDLNEDCNAFDLISQINLCFKTMQVLGQIAKNFHGSLLGDLKINITEECYCLGLRALGVLLNIIERDLQNLIENTIEFLRKEKKVNDIRELIEDTNKFVFALTDIIAFSFIQKINDSVGTEKLSETYEEILMKNNSVSFSLIDLSIKLDNFKIFPEKDIIYLEKKISNNVLALTVLKQLVHNYFHLKPSSYKTRQKICELLNISYKEIKDLEEKN